MILLNDLSERLQIDDPEERHTISPVSWSQYETLLSVLGDRSSYRISYLDPTFRTSQCSTKRYMNDNQNFSQQINR
ncbi:MAG: hypothetical protein F6K23_39235 [Okeania sp. SIO2C9]|uniref:hypothetical protein n=1 Tax=Okeania sp. SIO2C9 TaxID=2607791 RepID=UPI0013BF65F5|nr:hypothetical protein [Okeania sp. SIO2C9]NEQ78500.1 hypothetical protein [Okeania sp. SIO2C9]